MMLLSDMGGRAIRRQARMPALSVRLGAAHPGIMLISGLPSERKSP